MRVVVSLPGMDRVQVRRDVVYKNAGAARLAADVYRPADAADAERAPAVVLLHGGPIAEGLTPKDWGVFRSIGELVAASGLAAVAFNHRFHGPQLLAEAAADVRDLLRHLRENAAGLGVDGERLGLWAFSGGGPFLSTALREGPAQVRAIVAYYALMDLQQRPPGVAPGSPGDLPDELRRAYSPLHHMATGGRRFAPMLLARAGMDHPWLNGTIDRFCAQALDRNAPIEIHNHPKGRHGFDILDDDERSSEILLRTLEFLKSRLR